MQGKTLFSRIVKAVSVLGLLYAFLCSIELLSASFKLMGEGFANQLMQTTSNPIVGLFIGLLITAIVQSSSCTTSLVVAVVSSGAISIPNAVPIIMGANIGTTITNTLVSFGSMGRRDEFRRAMGAATVHDMFNVLCVSIFLPLELLTHFLQTSAMFLADLFANVGGLKFASPLNLITRPVVDFCSGTVAEVAGSWGAAVLGVVALVMLFFALMGMVKSLRSASAGRFEVLFDKYVGRYPYLALLLGVVVTGIVQSSSAVTSLMVPIVGAGILTVEQIYPVTLGANMGTTVTALLAALSTGDVKALAIAFVHSLFNVCGTVLFFVIPWNRRIPIGMARWLAALCAKARYYAILYVLAVFFIVPGMIILVQKLLAGR